MPFCWLRKGNRTLKLVEDLTVMVGLHPPVVCKMVPGMWHMETYWVSLTSGLPTFTVSTS